MRNPKFKEIKPNYRKQILEICLKEGKRVKSYELPFAIFFDKKISAKNKFISLKIDKEAASQGASFVLEDGSRGNFPADLVLYYCDPDYRWSPLNQLKNLLKKKIQKSQLSLRLLANTLHTSPTQINRLLQTDRVPKQLGQLIHLAHLAGYELDIILTKKLAA